MVGDGCQRRHHGGIVLAQRGIRLQALISGDQIGAQRIVLRQLARVSEQEFPAAGGAECIADAGKRIFLPAFVQRAQEARQPAGIATHALIHGNSRCRSGVSARGR